MAESTTLQILICDDDKPFLELMHTKIKMILEDQEIPAAIHAYSSIEAVPENILECSDLAFLDIDFQEEERSGIDLARMMRAAHHDTIIIFVSNYIEYAPEGYEVQAFRYVLKSEVPQKLEQYVAQAISKQKSVRQTMQISVAGEKITVLLSDVLYFESQGHTVLTHLCNEQTYRFYASLGKLEQELESKGFLRIHKGFLVNMAYIQQFKSSGAVLSGNILISVSAKSYAEKKQRYLLWKGRQ